MPGPSRTALLAALACALLGAALGGAGSVAAAGIKDPNTIACPSPPSGWIAPPEGGKSVINPLADPVNLNGKTVVDVSCQYFTKAGKHIELDVSYALPTDKNPIVNFHFGCSTGGTAWSKITHVYRVMSTQQWSIADFTDYLGLLTPHEIPVFEKLTQKLLQNANGYGHGCTVGPNDNSVTKGYKYRFRSAAGGGSVSFKTKTGVIGTTGSLEVVSSNEPTLTLRVQGDTLTVAAIGGGRFYPARPTQQPKLTLPVRVVDSTLPTCGKGNGGTLVLTAASLELRVCSKSFSGGKTTARVTPL